MYLRAGGHVRREGIKLNFSTYAFSDIQTDGFLGLIAHCTQSTFSMKVTESSLVR